MRRAESSEATSLATSMLTEREADTQPKRLSLTAIGTFNQAQECTKPSELIQPFPSQRD